MSQCEPVLSCQPGAEFRLAPRLKLPAMYTLVRVRPAGTQRYRWTGHVYDISTSGMRMELDHSLPPGTQVEIHAMLPGKHPTAINALGRIVRIHDDQTEQGPVRMGMTFNHFTIVGDQQRLADYLGKAGTNTSHPTGQQAA